MSDSDVQSEVSEASSWSEPMAPEGEQTAAPLHVFTRPPPELMEDGEEVIWDAWDQATAEERRKVHAPPITNPRSIKYRITTCVRILESLGAHREPDTTRRDYLKVLVNDLAGLYDYNVWLIWRFLSFLPPAEVVELLEANEAPRPLTIRANTLKTRRRALASTLIGTRHMTVDPLERWCPVGLVVYDSPVPVGGTPEHLAGHYIVQAAASFLPVLALQAQPGERILDMCAAPGGKTTHIAASMNNTGVLVANDLSPARTKSLASNLARMGVSNTIVTNYDGRAIPRVMSGFDRVLIDAPCTGTGVISKDPSVKGSRSSRDLRTLVAIQKYLLLAAIDCTAPRTDPGALPAKGAAAAGAAGADGTAGGSGVQSGVIVYSTCSVLVEENESVIAYALRKRDVEVVECGVNLDGKPFGRDGYTHIGSKRFPPSLAHARRLFPHVHNMDGFFVCKLVKRSNRIEEGTENLRSLPLSKRDRRKRSLAKRRGKAAVRAGELAGVGAADDDASSASDTDARGNAPRFAGKVGSVDAAVAGAESADKRSRKVRPPKPVRVRMGGGGAADVDEDAMMGGRSTRSRSLSSSALASSERRPSRKARGGAAHDDADETAALRSRRLSSFTHEATKRAAAEGLGNEEFEAAPPASKVSALKSKKKAAKPTKAVGGVVGGDDVGAVAPPKAKRRASGSVAAAAPSSLPLPTAAAAQPAKRKRSAAAAAPAEPVAPTPASSSVSKKKRSASAASSASTSPAAPARAAGTQKKAAKRTRV